ncbi:hypothetical protein FOMPIDRAFT_1054744 [Fomitopsis schrenkii]|uniref:Pyridine nucleotide-disulphide oxidoreductase dimerisation domain-containing protein n=1 Tax=Fomitopsis schrenkii TaxID=2126942 RepID=S8DQ69_FOMSC|nr:hypothetical protein FOMPIDRAFT_1054744 [Fomitopsis schrenkii]
MKKVEYMTGKFPFRANSRTNTNLDTKGTVKFMIEAMTDRILGVHNIDPNASEIIAEATLAVECGASSQEASNHCHPKHIQDSSLWAFSTGVVKTD